MLTVTTKDASAVDKIKPKTAVDHIKIVVKRTAGYTNLDLTNKQAGATTDATTKAMKQICYSMIGVNSKLYEHRDKLLGWSGVSVTLNFPP